MEEESKGNLRALVALAVAMFTMAMGIGFIIPLLPVFSEQLGAGGLWIGLIFGINPATRTLFMPIFGRMADTRGKKIFLVTGLSGYTVVALSMAAATQAWQLFALRALHGALAAMVMPVARAYVGVLTPEGREGRIMGLFNLSFFLGFALGPMAGGLLADVAGLRVPFLAMGSLSALSLAIVSLLVPEQVGDGTGGTAARPPFFQTLRQPVILGLFSGRAFNAMGRGVTVSLLPLFASGFLALSQSQIGILISVQALFASSLQPLTGWLADRYNRKHMAALGFILSPLALLLLPQAQSFQHLLFLGLLVGLSPGIFVPSSTAIAVVEGRTQGMGATMGVIEMAMSIGMATGAVAGGAVAQVLGLVPAFYVAAGFTMPGLLLFLWFLRDYQQDTGVIDRSNHLGNRSSARG